MATKDTLALIRESLAPTADGAENKLASSIKAALFAEAR